MRLRKSIFLVFGFILVVAIVAYVVRGKRPLSANEEEVVLVKRGDVILKATETGSLEPANTVEIKSEQSGEVKRLLVRAGDAVKTGQPLAAIQQESNQAKRVAEARAAIEEERLDWEEAQRKHERVAELFEKGFVARKEMEETEKDKSNAKIKYDLARRQLLLTLGGNQALYEKYLKRDLTDQTADEFTIYAPLSGTVIEIEVAEGEIVSSGTSTVTGGTTLMRIADLSRMWVKTKINEVNISQVREGQPVEVRLDAILGHLYQGKVVKISRKGEKVNNVVTYEVTIGLLDSDPRLMPSMTANVDIITRVARNVLYLPLIAIVQEGGSDAVTVRLSGGEIVTKPIKVAFKNETVAVADDGIHEGDQLLLPKGDRKENSR